MKPSLFDDLADQETASIFEIFDQDTSPENQIRCELLLEQLAPEEREVLSRVYFGGQTIREIAAVLRIPKSTVHDLKTKALLSLKKGNAGDFSDTRRYMKGSSCEIVEEQSPWDIPLPVPLSEGFCPNNPDISAFVGSIPAEHIRRAISLLPKRAQEILRLRFWCNQSVSQVARQLKCGVNVVEQVENASISKLTRMALDLGGFTKGEEPCF